MIRVSFRRIRPGKEGKLREWLEELMRRQDEVRETFRRETVRHEQAFILEDQGGSIMVYAIEAADHAQGARAVATSTLPIDLQHKEVMRDVLGAPVAITPIYDCALDPPAQPSG